VTTTTCPVCGTGFTPTRRQRFRRPACRQTAYRRSHQPTTTPTLVPAIRSRRDFTIYQCNRCEQRYLADQWCHDCNQPCIRIGPGGPCPHCDEPVAVADLLPTHATPHTTVDTEKQVRDAH
jgi:hypothetical protein